MDGIFDKIGYAIRVTVYPEYLGEKGRSWAKIVHATRKAFFFLSPIIAGMSLGVVGGCLFTAILLNPATWPTALIAVTVTALVITQLAVILFVLSTITLSESSKYAQG